MKHSLLLLLPVLFFHTGCYNFATLQSGKVLEKNQYEIVSYLSTAKTEHQIYMADDASDLDYYPYAGFRFKYGIGEKFDAGLLLDVSFNSAITTKYQFIGSQESYFAASSGIDVGFNFLSLGFAAQNYMMVSVPLYLSIHPSENASLYLTPRYIHNHRYGIRGNEPDMRGWLSANHRMVFTYGVLYGQRNKVAIEISHNGPQTLHPTHLTVGYVILLN